MFCNIYNIKINLNHYLTSKFNKSYYEVDLFACRILQNTKEKIAK